jgi:hypothetical protein
MPHLDEPFHNFPAEAVKNFFDEFPGSFLKAWILSDLSPFFHHASQKDSTGLEVLNKSK